MVIIIRPTSRLTCWETSFSTFKYYCNYKYKQTVKLCVKTSKLKVRSHCAR